MADTDSLQPAYGFDGEHPFCSDTQNLPADVDSTATAYNTSSSEITDGCPIPAMPEIRIEDQFSTLDEAFMHIQEHARERGFAVKKSTSKRRNGDIIRQYIHCCRGGPSSYTRVPAEQRQRKSSSMIMAEGCPFRASISCDRSSGKWLCQYLHDYHTHQSAEQTTTYAVHRRNARKAEPRILQQVAAGLKTLAPTSTTYNLIKSLHPEVPIELKDVVNARQQLINSEAGLPRMQSMIRHLKPDFLYQQSDDAGKEHLHHVVFTAKSSISLLTRWPFSLTLDCTYKTNRSNSYLCDVFGITSTNQPFLIAQAILSSEDEQSYAFVLRWLQYLYSQLSLPLPYSIISDGSQAIAQALQHVWPQVPHLLCQSRIQKDLQALAKPLFEAMIKQTIGVDSAGKEIRRVFVKGKCSALKVHFQSIIDAQSEPEYDHRLANFFAKWKPQYPSIVIRLNRQWLPYRRKFCRPWTGQVRHFDVLTTSRIENAHRVVRSQLPPRQLLQLEKRIELLQRHVNDGILSRLDKERIAHSTLFRQDPIFQSVVGIISNYALERTYEHAKMLCNGTPFSTVDISSIAPCSQHFKSVLGIPCGHVYLARLHQSLPFCPKDFHRQWLLDPHIAIPALVPMSQQDPARTHNHLGSMGKTREQSLFEYIDRLVDQQHKTGEARSSNANHGPQSTARSTPDQGNLRVMLDPVHATWAVQESIERLQDYFSVPASIHTVAASSAMLIPIQVPSQDQPFQELAPSRSKRTHRRFAPF